MILYAVIDDPAPDAGTWTPPETGELIQTPEDAPLEIVYPEDSDVQF